MNGKGKSEWTRPETGLRAMRAWASARVGVAGAMLLSLAGAAGASGLGGCGNYSNQDLEFMNALPLRDDVAVEVPRQSSLTTAGSAEGWQRTFKVTRDMNGVATAFLSLIDQIRSVYPTTRDANTRIWGPFPADGNPGWGIAFHMTKVVLDSPHFDYQLLMIPPVGVGAATSQESSIQIISGDFVATGGARLGTGHLVITVDQARAAGLALTGLEKLVSLTIDYQNLGWPRGLTMSFMNVEPAAAATDAVSGTYHYLRQENGDGAMTFSLVGNLVDAAAGDSTISFDSRWLGSGPGREDLSVTAGVGAGATGTECWNQSFMSTFKVRSWWQPDMNTGAEATCVPR